MSAGKPSLPVEVVPAPDEQVSFCVAGRERLRWHYGARHPRPFFWPVIGPSGRMLTRMGHPADANHEHHRSWWFGHRDVAGINFWEERPTNRQQIRQMQWLHYQDGESYGGMAVRLGWFDAHNTLLVQQDFYLIVQPLPQEELWLEWCLQFTTPLTELRLGQTNFGFAGLRVARSISAHYGGGRLSNSEGGIGEAQIFAKPARWTDYSGPSAGASGAADRSPEHWEGITWFDHRDNPGHPTSWHVRDDGWMSAAFNLRQAYLLRKGETLTLRYGFHVHRGDVQRQRAEELWKQFAARPTPELRSAQRPWRYRLEYTPVPAE
jgi:hypothetical protein